MLKFKNLVIADFGEDSQELGLKYFADGKVKWYKNFSKQFYSFMKLNINLTMTQQSHS